MAAARGLVLLGALAGIFAMHGLSDHGTMRDSGADMAFAAGGEHSQMTPSSESESVAVPGHDMDAAMAMCVAVLAGLALFFLRSRRVWAVHSLREATARQSSRVIARARPPDPPNLFALSIQRC